MTNINKGDTLKNGAIVLDVSTTGVYGVVLADMHGQFVTWEFRTDELNTYWGHYFNGDEAAAKNDFTARCAALRT